MSHLHAQAGLDEDLGELEQWHDEKEAGMHDRVEQKRDRDLPIHACPWSAERTTSGSQVAMTSSETLMSRRAGVGGSSPSRFASECASPPSGQRPAPRSSS